jgi:putative transposase
MLLGLGGMVGKEKGSAGNSLLANSYMPKRKTQFHQWGYYHIYNRGVAKQAIFLDDADYKHFLFLIHKHQYIQTRSKNSKERLISLECYCFMPNHFHLLLQQQSNNGVQQFFHRCMTAYSNYFNYKYGRVGPLFQGRTQAKAILDNKHFRTIVRYILRNPIKITRDIRHYGYSNFRFLLQTKYFAQSAISKAFLDKQYFLKFNGK